MLSSVRRTSCFWVKKREMLFFRATTCLMSRNAVTVHRGPTIAGAVGDGKSRFPLLSQQRAFERTSNIPPSFSEREAARLQRLVSLHVRAIGITNDDRQRDDFSNCQRRCR